MPPVPQVAQEISQEQSQRQNGPNLSSLHSSLPVPHSRNTAFLRQVQPAGCDKKHVLLVPTPVPVRQQENEILQQVTALRREGLWSLKRLPKLQEAPRHKSHHDYLLEETQWMATDFVQERRWKITTAKRLILSVARHHEDTVLHKEKCKKREETQLRTVAAFTAREIEHFWSTIKQVVDLKRQVELEERRKKVLNSQNISEKELRDCLNKKESLQKEVVLPDLLTPTVKKYMGDLADTAAVAKALLPKGMQHSISRDNLAQILPKLKVTRKLIEEIYCSPSSPRLEPMRLKPNRLFTLVRYGQKPEGRARDFSRSQLQQTVDTATVMADHNEKIQRRQPLAMFSENQHRKRWQDSSRPNGFHSWSTGETCSAREACNITV
ncbi:PREDICTED: E1A-binding protein p400-like [Pygoscelis adeliae]|uniref:E1A-binding protein p400-like n=1 Tax=Pygoscelis adeliae TaxID=9238 RepID=UPI0004F50842|nr:PREDICTED: E1A-binding protein p400-like [Pygoscelis adeliae]